MARIERKWLGGLNACGCMGGLNVLYRKLPKGLQENG
jgi:hypothetical protein